MSCSEAQLLANRANALKSSGPRTVEGKARSRANAYKHGLTGAAIVIADEDATAIDRRIEEIEEELRPRGGLSRLLIRRVAALSVRLDRAVVQESATLATRVRHAAEAFDDARTDEADHLIGWIAAEPPTFRRKLERTPEGCDRLIWALQGLRTDLLHGGEVGDGAALQSRWSLSHGQKFDEYTGRRDTDYPASRCHALTRAMDGDPGELFAGEGEGLDPLALRGWARDRLVEEIDAQITLLHLHRGTIDLEAIEDDRADAGRRALFDDSPGAILARKYEAANERQMFRTIQQIQDLNRTETPPLATPPISQPPQPQAIPPQRLAVEAGRTGESPLGSFFPAADPARSTAVRGCADGGQAPNEPVLPPTRVEFEKISRGSSIILPARV